MSRLKLVDVRKMKPDELEGKLLELRAELTKLKTASARGTIAKESGKIKNLRRNIARMLTVMNEMKNDGGGRA